MIKKKKENQGRKKKNQQSKQNYSSSDKALIWPLLKGNISRIMYLSPEQYALFIQEYKSACETYKPVYTFKWSNCAYIMLILFPSPNLLSELKTKEL